MTDLLLGLILAVAVGYGLWHFKRTLQSGGSCCSSGAAPVKKTGTRGKRKKTYPFRYLATVEGMHCGNCATRVENAFNAKEQYWADVDLARLWEVV